MNDSDNSKYKPFWCIVSSHCMHWFQISCMNWLLYAISAQSFSPITAGALVNGSVLIASISFTTHKVLFSIEIASIKKTEKKEKKNIWHIYQQVQIKCSTSKTYSYVQYDIIGVSIRWETIMRTVNETKEEKRTQTEQEYYMEWIAGIRAVFENWETKFCIDNSNKQCNLDACNRSMCTFVKLNTLFENFKQ